MSNIYIFLIKYRYHEIIIPWIPIVSNSSLSDVNFKTVRPAIDFHWSLILFTVNVSIEPQAKDISRERLGYSTKNYSFWIKVWYKLVCLLKRRYYTMDITVYQK